MSTGWTVPEWLKDTDWADLQLVTLSIANMEKLPDYSPDMPITITHSPDADIKNPSPALMVRALNFLDDDHLLS